MLLYRYIDVILTSGVPSVNRIDLRALTLVGSTSTRQVLDPLAVIHLDNRLFIITLLIMILYMEFPMRAKHVVGLHVI